MKRQATNWEKIYVKHISDLYQMVSFMCQFNCPVSLRLNIISGNVCEGVFRWDYHLNWWTQYIDLPSEASSNQMRAWIDQNVEGEIHPFFSASVFEMGHLISSLSLGVGFIPVAPLVLRPSNSYWITTSRFSWVSSLNLAYCRSPQSP